MQVRARQGDTVDALCWRHLGRTLGVVEATLERNKGLAATTQLQAGQLVDLVEPATTAPPASATVQLWD